jgi:hypothetical protein
VGFGPESSNCVGSPTSLISLRHGAPIGLSQGVPSFPHILFAMHRLTVIALTLLVVFASVLPTVLARETNGDRFRRGYPPLPPSRREVAKRQKPSTTPPKKTYVTLSAPPPPYTIPEWDVISSLESPMCLDSELIGLLMFAPALSERAAPSRFVTAPAPTGLDSWRTTIRAFRKLR